LAIETTDVPEPPLLSQSTPKDPDAEEHDYLVREGLREEITPVPLGQGPFVHVEVDESCVPEPAAVPEALWTTLPFTHAPSTRNRPPGSQAVDIQGGEEVVAHVTRTFSDELAFLREEVRLLKARMQVHDEHVDRLEQLVRHARADLAESESKRTALEARFTNLMGQHSRGIKEWITKHTPLKLGSTSTGPHPLTSDMATPVAATTSKVTAPVATASGYVPKKRMTVNYGP